MENEMRRRLVAFAPYAGLVLAVLLAYANVYRNAFLFDDLLLITGNKFLTSWHYAGTMLTAHVSQASGTRDAYYRPLQSLLFLLIAQTAGLSTIAFHLLNVTLHALNACLLFALGVRLGFQRIAAFLAALLWALHPVHTEAVTYMSGTADPLCGLFLLAAVFVLARDMTPRRIAGACLLFMLGLSSKETAVVFPLLAMGLIFYRSGRRWSDKAYLKTGPFWLIAALYLLARATVLNFNGFFGLYNLGDMSFADRVFTFLATLPAYLQLLVWPTGLHMERSFPVYNLAPQDLAIYLRYWIPPVGGGLLLLLAMVTAAVWKPSGRATPLAWGILWAAALHLPQSGVLVPATALFYEHWLYLPTMGLALGIGETLARLRWKPEILAGAACVVAVVLGVLTFQQNKIWRDPVTFYTHIFDCGEDSIRARNNLGIVYTEKGHYDAAIAQFRHALALADDNTDAHYNLGFVLVTQYADPASVAEGVGHLQRALVLNPNQYKADDVLAAVYARRGDTAKAAEYRANAEATRKRLGLE